ncbi:MAG: c-type cytochrome [Gammaproteobacteria bacterium]
MLSKIVIVVCALFFLPVGLASAADDTDTGFSAEQIAAGASLYADNCARCHGIEMVEPAESFFDLRTFPPDQRSRFMNSVANGKNSMPPWRSVLSEKDMSDLFAYVISAAKE